MNSPRPKPVLLTILDGWGCRDKNGKDNAIDLANTPNWDRFTATCPYGKLNTSGLDVGLPEGQMGNSEVGHMNIGSGRIVMQELPRIDTAVKEGTLAQNKTLQEAIAKVKDTKGTFHLLGLMSPGGVHAHQSHIAALANIIAAEGVPVAVHVITDGRDTPPRSALDYLKQFEAEIAQNSNIKIATLGGRYYAMDRDRRYERVQLAYDAMVFGEGNRIANAQEAIEASYLSDKGDEFIEPVVIGDYKAMQDKDAVLMANFRADRARQIMDALVNINFDGFSREKTIDFVAQLGMVEYSSELSGMLNTLFTQESLNNILAEVLANNGLTQLHTAETEKYAHVTFFFNGGREEPFEGEDRELVASPKVATYDLQPEMSAPEVTEKILEGITSGKYDFIVANYANTDMVGHTGDLDAAIKAVETVDTCLGVLAAAIEEAEGAMLITADHGNAEQMLDLESGQKHTAHTLNPVPLVLVGKIGHNATINNGRLADIAPTILDIMGIDKPDEMTGSSLLETTN